jgi:Ala-tRNA(Pro) deacylase
LTETYQRLLDLLNSSGARYRIINHAAAGRTDEASEVRGHALSQAAKCLVVRVSIGKKARRYLLAVIPGDRKVDLSSLCHVAGGTHAAFARRDIAERLTGSMSGTIMPFSFHADLELIADTAMLDTEELFFSACRLDRSVAIATDDYVRIARPRIENIALAVGADAEPRPWGVLISHFPPAAS